MPCKKIGNLSAKVVQFESVSLLEISSADVVEFVVRDPFNQEILNGSTKENAILREISNDSQFDIFTANSCGEMIFHSTVSTYSISADEPFQFNLADYRSVRAWQGTGIPFAQWLDENDTLSDFTKASLYQRLTHGKSRFEDEVMHLDIRFQKRLQPTSNGKSLNGDGCCCAAINLNLAYEATPSERIHENGFIIGEGLGPDHTDRRWSDGRIRTDAYGYWEGPGRYQDLYGQSLRRAKVPYTFYYNGDQGTDNTANRPDDEIVQPGFFSNIYWNYMCMDERQVESNCACERNINVGFDYESVVNATAERSGGRRSEARATAVDFAQITFLEERFPAETYDIWMTQVNARTQQCDVTYNGPSAGDFLQFANRAYQLVLSVPGPGDDPGPDDFEWTNELVDIVSAQLDAAFDEDWLTFSNCGGNAIGQHRRFSNTPRAVTRRNIALRPNNPVIISLAVGGTLEVQGQINWNANASIHSSYWLASLMRGGGNPINQIVDDCCSPWVATWMLSPVASNQQISVGSTASEDNLEDAVQNFFGQNGQPHFIFARSGALIDRQGYNCTEPPRITVRGDVIDWFAQNFDYTQTHDNFTFQVKPELGLMDSETKFNLYSVDGKLISTLDLHPHQRSITFPAHSLPQGIYVIMANNSEMGTVSRKILIQ